MRMLFAMLVSLLSFAASAALEQGYHTYDYSLPAATGKNGQVMKVWYYKPSHYTADTPVLFVFHGRKRDADNYSAQWKALAEKYNLMLLVPEYSTQLYPGANGYNLGNVYHAVSRAEVKGLVVPKEINPKDQWSFTLADKIFADFKTREDSHATRYYAYGHGGGSQYLLRMLMFYPEAKIKMAIVANPGWYTLPSRDERWPYGLRGVDVIDTATLKRFFALPLTLMLGDHDDDFNHYLFRNAPEANRTGIDGRFERGHYYFNYARDVTKALNTPLNWQEHTVKGAEHDNFIVQLDAVQAIMGDINESK
ncbi:hypothetical protein [Gallaecimonas pentaromativorans]|uniref:Alpha/beta hydrolase n=1 Tax=Gallaecimonas pentaromativorans TaxID=584787 RepID=A0A3N1P377_9GAMM|nr:hypothetical protein [Gallaecimonas pentaromativorans]ROQ21961.1 hypothetical protein EDC28_11163 [Gallaecimonas pentaromativorans]